jgi:hypothetical protein
VHSVTSCPKEDGVRKRQEEINQGQLTLLLAVAASLSRLLGAVLAKMIRVTADPAGHRGLVGAIGLVVAK